MKKTNTIIFYIVIILLFIATPNLINYLRFSDKIIISNYIFKEENEDLKKELNELTNINYQDYDYILAKLSIKNLYNSNVYYLSSDNDINESLPVINQYGLIGITSKNNTMITTNDLSLSIKVNNVIGKYSKGILSIDTNLNIKDKIYTSGLTNIPSNILVGEVSKINKDNTYEIKLITNNTNYVAILKDYSL